MESDWEDFERDYSDAEASDSTEFTSDDDEADDRDSKILASYRRLLSRRVDLVGDYAGDELFLIEGDSLLLRCFDDDKLDFTTGLQILHAAYNVEHFLHHLAQRKCHFNLIFFDGNRELCVPALADQKNANKYFLARAAIVRHLQANLAKSHPDITVHTFTTHDSPEFVTYLEKTSPYFLMAHDGARAVARQSKFLHGEDDDAKAEPTKQRVALREMVLSFVQRGFNVALVNGLEWRDTKVMTMVLETRKRGEMIQLPEKDSKSAAKLPQQDITAKLDKLGGSKSDLTARELVLAIAASILLKDSDSEGTGRLVAALLLHAALLTHLPLASRRLDVLTEVAGAQRFLETVASIIEAVLNSASWPGTSDKCDLMDVLDGRLFLNIAVSKPKITAPVKATFDKLLQAVISLSGTAGLEEPPANVSDKATPQVASEETEPGDLSVLPFSNKVFDKHLESVRIRVDAAASGERSLASRKVFQEVSHWHNYKRPVGHRGPIAPADTKAAFWAAKRNQLFMAEMRTYAASLTNAVGKSLEPETIIVGVPRQATKIKSGTDSPAESDLSDSGASSTQSKGKPAPKKGGGGKTAQKNAGKQAMLNQIAAAKAKKDESAGDKIASSWAVVCKGFEADRDPRSRYRKAKEYLTHLQPSWRDTIGPECELYMLSCLLHYWIAACKRKEQEFRIQVAALIWSHARSIAQRGPLPKTIIKYLELTVKTLGLPPLPQTQEASTDRKLAFTFALPTQADSLDVKLPPKEFQLLQCGPYLERSFDSKPDPRVDFQPDGWQRKVLDTIDADQSVFVVAPTSAGKTFISFYAMRKVLEADDDGVLIYVAPTKALVNQIAAEVQARYSKKFKYGGKSVWAIHTRDYRINNPTGCQVLVTVPHVLQIMLLAPSNANSWSSRVKRIIFDEIHSIGQAEDGVVWEQLLLMAPCPIIALSATVGNPDEFSGWLGTTQEAIGKELVTVHHPFRYSDLRKYFYVPPKQFTFTGIPAKSAFGSLGLEGLPGFNFVHPVAGLVDKSRGIPEDLALEPRDCYFLWQAMVKVQTPDFSIPAKLDPAKALPEVSRKVDILKWEKDLKEVLRTWLADASSPYDKLVKELEQSFRDEEREELYTTSAQVQSSRQAVLPIEELNKTTLPMLCRLHEQDALPAILFNYDRHQCEKICKAVVEQLESAELKQRKTGPKWAKTLEAWEQWKKLKAKQASSKASKAKATKKSKDDDDDDKTSKLDNQRDEAGGEETKWESFDPEAPQEGYHFADHTKVQTSELEIYIRQLRRRDVPQWLISSLTRGIGVHHAGMNRKYRQVVEILFRKGFLRVIVATGTLALGINMPCKTVVFSGDSVFLTALNYRQCAGRAGRRGFDLLGNVVFQGVSRQKVCRLLSSRLPDLNGHFPITTTLVLRLFTLLHESDGAKYAVSAINALLSQPRLYMGGPSFKDQTMHHLRFSIEYLRRQHLLGSDGAPLNFAGLVSHLYFTENSSFAFHSLLKEGYFHELCAGIATNEKDTLETLMLIMSHLFNRAECRQADAEYREKVVKPSSSIVFLPPMPSKASKILMDHNKQTLKVFRAYVETFVQQHISTEDSKLPLSGLEVGAEETGAGIPTLPPTHIRSSFVALSGAGDSFDSLHDLCQTTRDGVFLEEAVIPHMDVYPEEMEVPLNAYLLDFFKHGDVLTIERANGIRRADIWFLLNDFSLVLATIITSLMNFMKLSEGSDMDMLDIMGRMDTHEEEEDDKVAAVEDQASEISAPSAADSGVALPERAKPKEAPTKKQAKNADSWEDLAGDEEAEEEADEATKKQIAAEEAEELLGNGASWEGEGGEGLKNVLKAFQTLHAQFNVKFRAMWA
ncbi:hypothetical protein M409DRAFT_67177 [Zasmidium cellare ATCC 36951]|uniref:P-loop containing nucleoside triphosphate hydrolase protein n=1 Tax=Zasmidium cellare ATCC 36951 TaxID=1080233 RepID=A0A6A6CDN3_ZASCE|nr:uncharacterized protein M409DRAFT_67177 [Zasmidium cellare ATCC 36951]KAF2165304.1 hypothetical protein M409DRAFT_67177 [Zasmidium cellare ATCC 36951]